MGDIGATDSWAYIRVGFLIGTEGMDLLRGILGLVTILAIAFALSADRKAIQWKTVAAGLSLQIVLALLLLKGPDMATWFAPLGWVSDGFAAVSSFFVNVLDYTQAGTSFLFGNMADPAAELGVGFVFAFQVLPIIIFFGSLMAVLYHLGIMQRIVQAMALVVRRTLGVSGAESLSVTANIFVGQTEAPLVVKPFINRMTRSEIMAVMAGGMATIAGSVMAAYIALLGDSFAAWQGLETGAGRALFAKQLLAASVMAAPASLLLSKMLIPETEIPETRDSATIAIDQTHRNVIDAAASGAGDGLRLAANVGAMLLAFLALIAMLNGILGGVGSWFDVDLSLELMLGYLLAPLAWLIGIPSAEITAFGSLIGQKVILNEFVAYVELSKLIEAGTLSTKSITMATFALCGFANLSSIAIQIGGLGPIAPDRKGVLVELGLRAVLVGTLATLMTATIAGALL